VIPRDTSRSLSWKRISNQLTGEVRLASGGDPQSGCGVRTPRLVEIENRTVETPLHCESIRALDDSVSNVRCNTFCSWIRAFEHLSGYVVPVLPAL
jgi:hypothetical protein